MLPAACVSVGMKGQELTDMDALKAAGAVGFTDDGIPLMDQEAGAPGHAEGEGAGRSLELP